MTWSLSSTAKEPLFTPQLKLLLLIFGVSAFLLISVSLISPYPTGWDVFYSLRVLELTKSSSFLPYDELSAGGRVHSYPPSYYSLVIAFSSLTNTRLELSVKLLSPILFSLTVLALFALARRKFGTNEAILAVLLFSTSFEVFDAFVSIGMAASLGHFLSAFCLFAFLFLPASLFFFFAFLLGSVHFLSATAVAVYLLFLTLHNRNYHKLALGVICLGLFPLFWHMLFPTYNIPDWGTTFSLLEIINRVGLIQATLFFLSISRDPFFLASLFLFLLSVFSPLLATRWIYFAMPPLVLSVAAWLSRMKPFLASIFSRSFRLAGPFLFLAFLAVPLLLNHLHTSIYAKPFIQSEDFDGLKWLSINTSPKSVVVGYKDLSAVWVIYYANRATVLDGYSESVPNVYERMHDQYSAYEEDMDTARHVLSTYNVSYIFYDKTEKDWFNGRFDLAKFDSVPSLFDNGFARIIRLA